MDYLKISELQLDEIMKQIRVELGIAVEKPTPSSIPHSMGSAWETEKIDKNLADAIIGTQIGQHKAPMHLKKGLMRKMARVIEKIYLRVAELTNRDIREFNSKILNILYGFKDALSQLFDHQEQFKQMQESYEANLHQKEKEFEERLSMIQKQLQDYYGQLRKEMTQVEQQEQFLQQQARELECQKQQQAEDAEEYKQLFETLKEKICRIEASIPEGETVDQRVQSQIEEKTVVFVEQFNQLRLEQHSMRDQVGRLKAIMAWANNAEFLKDTAQTKKAASGQMKTADALFYHDFEEKFRGTQQDIRERLTVYLPELKKHFGSFSEKRFIDLACGRGEWLDVLAENGAVNAEGVDLNNIQLNLCRDKKHHVVCQDLFAYLEKQEDASADMISGFQIIEHLPMESLLLLFQESRRVLRPNGIILFETPNSMNLLTASVWFYVDPTHERPIHKEVARFLAERSGFSEVQIFETNPAKYVKTLEKPICFDGNQAIWNENVELLNQMLYGPQDYAVLGVKK